MGELSVKEADGGVVFTAKVVPGSSRTAICGLLDGMLKVKVSAAPEKGKANQCLASLLAGQFGVRKSAVSIVSGRSSAVKQVRVSGITSAMLLAKLNLNAQHHTSTG
jgi:uncharacterized protein (TIGR00251 family)